MIYGHQGRSSEYPLMEHKTGFTMATLATWISAVGFTGMVHRQPEDYVLVAEGYKVTR